MDTLILALVLLSGDGGIGSADTDFAVPLATLTSRDAALLEGKRALYCIKIVQAFPDSAFCESSVDRDRTSRMVFFASPARKAVEQMTVEATLIIQVHLPTDVWPLGLTEYLLDSAIPRK